MVDCVHLRGTLEREATHILETGQVRTGCSAGVAA